MGMKITVTKIYKIEGKSGTVAICDLNLGSEFALNGIILNKGKEGGFHLQFPFVVRNRKGVKEYTDVCYPLTANGMARLTEQVVAEYQAKWGGETA